MIFNMKKLFNETGIIENSFYKFDVEKMQRLSLPQCLKYLVENDLFIASSCNKVIKRKIIVENDLYFKVGSVGEDIEWCAKLMLLINKIDAINNAFYIYRKQRDNSVSNIKDVSYKKIDNVLTIIEDCLDQSKKMHLDKTLYDAHMSFLAYQYSTILGLLGTLKGDKKDIIKRMKKISYILKYDTNYKVKKVGKLYSLVGFTFTTLILGIFIMLKQ